jgi:predicted HicB family RNase H-like nuclease
MEESLLKKECPGMADQTSRYTEAQKRSAEKYLQEKVEDIRIRVPKGEKAVIKVRAEAQGKSLNQYILDAIKEYEKGEH